MVPETAARRRLELCGRNVTCLTVSDGLRHTVWLGGPSPVVRFAVCTLPNVDSSRLLASKIPSRPGVMIVDADEIDLCIPGRVFDCPLPPPDRANTECSYASSIAEACKVGADLVKSQTSRLKSDRFLSCVVARRFAFSGQNARSLHARRCLFWKLRATVEWISCEVVVAGDTG